MNLGSQSKGHRNKKRVRAITELCAKKGVCASALKGKMKMSSQQLAFFLKRIDEVERFKKYNRYRYTVNWEEVPNKIEYGDHWVEIEEKDEKIIIRNSEGEEKTIRR